MKKILFFSLATALILPMAVFAQADTATQEPPPPTQQTTTTPTPPVTYNGTCASNAVIAHENAQETIVETRQASMKVAAIARRDALGAAYLLTDKPARDSAIKAAHDAFLTAQKVADKTAMDSSKTENKSFKDAMKGCGADTKLPPQTRDEMANQNGPDNNISQTGGGQSQEINNQDQTQNQQQNPGKINNKIPPKQQGQQINGNGQPNQQPQQSTIPQNQKPINPNQNQNQQNGQQNQPPQQQRPWWKLW